MTRKNIYFNLEKAMHLLSMKHFKNAVSVLRAFQKGDREHIQGVKSWSQELHTAWGEEWESCKCGYQGPAPKINFKNATHISTNHSTSPSPVSCIIDGCANICSSPQRRVAAHSPPHSGDWLLTAPIWRNLEKTASFTSVPHCRSSRLHPLWTAPVGY